MTDSLQAIKKDFSGKKVLIMGLGVQGGGLGALKFFLSIGSECRVTDLRSADQLQSSLSQIDQTIVKLTLGRHEEADIEWCDVIIRNPAVPRHAPFLKLALDNHKFVLMETALFAKYARRPIVGITGTRGKTTTTTLIHRVLSTTQNQTVTLGGNIPGQSSLDLLAQDNETTICHVLELSSWQLQGFDDLKISPYIAVLTNIYPDHLNKYHSMNDYIADKAVITQYQTQNDHFIYNLEDQEVIKIAQSSQAHLHGFRDADIDPSMHLKLLGQHNRANAAAALKVARIFDIDVQKALQILAAADSIPYRYQLVATKNDINFINDTTSTTPTATIVALRTQTRPTLLILGGQSKNLPLEKLLNTLKTTKYLKGIILIPGSGTAELKPHLPQERIMADCQSLDEAVAVAVKHAGPGDDILLSPGFTSFDQYKNEFERGDHFNQIVSSINL